MGKTRKKVLRVNYYNEIKDTLIKNEIYKKAKDYSKNKSEGLYLYWIKPNASILFNDSKTCDNVATIDLERSMLDKLLNI